MGGDNSKSKSILDYYVFQKKINKYLNNKAKRKEERYSIKEGYIINPEWIKEWKKIIDYKKIAEYCDSFKINSSKKLNKNQKMLINQFIENDYKVSHSNFKTNISLIVRNKDFEYLYGKHISNNYWENFMNKKTYEELKINKNNKIEKINYILKKEILILFIKEKIIKMFIQSNQLVNLTLIFFDKNYYEKFKNFFEEEDSKTIKSYLKKKGIFLNPIYEDYKQISKNKWKLTYIIRNEDCKNQDNQKNTIKNPVEIDFSLVNRVSYRGLENVGATCYMNATLQCLANIKPITDYLLEQNNYIYLFENKSLCELTLNYCQVLLGLFCDKSTIGFYCPENFKKKISELNPLFQGIQANDSKDLIIFLLENINTELVNIHNKKKNNIENKNEPFKILDISNEKLILENFIENYHKNYCTIIGAHLCGFTKSVFRCQKCNERAISFNIFNFLIFSLEATSNYFNLSYNGTTLPIITFEHCFKFLTKEEIFQEIYCQNCRQTGFSNYKDTIYSMPNYLIIILNRGKGNIFNCQVDIPLKFDSSKYIEKKINMNNIYELIGIVSHFGESGMGGHFISFCRHNIDKKWRCFNDSIVTECQNDYLKKGTPYILFYKRDIIEKNIENKNSNNQINNSFNLNMNNYNFKKNINVNNNMKNIMFKNMNNNMNINMNNSMNNIMFNNINNYMNNNMNINMNNNMNNSMNNIMLNNNNYMNSNMNNNMNNNINFFH